MNHVQVRRMKRIIEHLRSKKLAHKKFDFSVISDVETGKKPKFNGCGTAGCAMGEYPAIFPTLFKWGVYSWVDYQDITNYDISVVERGMNNNELDNEEFLGITYEEHLALFNPTMDYYSSKKPGAQACGLKGVKYLSSKATPKQVAQNLENFLKAKGLW